MRNQNHPKNNQRTLWIGVLCLLLAAVLRLAAFDEALIGADQTSILAAAANIASGRDFPGVGIKSSVGVMQTAVTGYLAALPLLLVHRIIAIKWFFSLLDLLALALLYRATRRAFGPLAAAAAGLLYAANPWVVEFNRWIWYQTLIPTFATMAFAAFLHLLRKRRGRRSEWMLALGLVSAALMAMVHLAAVPWAGVLFLLGAFLAWRYKLWQGLGLGLGLSAIIVAPYGLYLIQTRFADVGILTAGNGAASESALNLATYRLARELLTGAQVLATPRSPLWAASVVAPDAAYAVIPLLLGIAALSALYRLIRRDAHSAPLAFALGWTLLAPTIFAPTSIHLQHFYLLFLFPAPYVVIAAWLGWSTRQRAAMLRWTARIGLALVILLCGWWSYLWGVRIHYEHQGQLRAPTRAWLMDRTAAMCASYLEENPTGQMILLIDFEGHLSPFDWLRSWLDTDRLRVVPANVGFIRPATETCYMLGPRVTEDALAPVADQARPRPEMTVPAQPPWRVHCIPPRAPLPDPLASWENGLSLLETKIDGELTPGGRLQVHHTWHYRAAAEKEYHLFNHLMRGETDTTMVAQVDGSGVPTWYWRDDDVLHTSFQLPLPDALTPGKYRLLIGAYTWPEITRVFLEGGEAEYEVRRWRLPQD